MKEALFWKQSATSAVATAIRIVFAFLTNKFLAMVTGPVAFAAVGQLQNLLNIGHATSSLSLQNGWVALTARYKEMEKSLGPIWRGGFRISVYASIATSIFFALFTFIAPLEQIFPGMPKRMLQASLLFAIPGMISLSVTSICAAVTNGLSDYKRWAAITAVSSVLNGLWVVLTVQTKSLTVLSAVATQSVVSCLFAVWNAHKSGFRYKRFRAELDANFKPWRGYAAMGLTPMILTPALYLCIRSFLGNSFGWDAAGFWQGAVRISDLFNVGFSSILGVVLLPRLSAASSRTEFQKISKALLIRTLTLAAIAIAVLAVFREPVIVFALSEKFRPLSECILPQFAGDFFKAGCWCLGLSLIARKETVAFLSVEIFADVLFAALTIFGANVWGYHSPFIAYAIENAASFSILIVLVRRIPWKDR